MKKRISASIDEELIEKVKELASSNKMSFSFVVNRLLDSVINKELSEEGKNHLINLSNSMLPTIENLKNKVFDPKNKHVILPDTFIFIDGDEIPIEDFKKTLN